MAWTQKRRWFWTASALMLAVLFLALAFDFNGAVVQARTVTTHYIAASGSDSNDGLSTSTPWAHLPGMRTCTGNCASYTPGAGDQFILKGGDTWTHANFPDIWPSAGASGNPIYIGVAKTWYSGSAWTRPVFDGGNTNLSSSNDLFLDLRNRDYITADNIEFANFAATNWQTYATCGMIQTDGDQNISIENIYVHDFAVDAASAGNCFVVHAPTYSPYGGNTKVENSILDGSATAATSNGYMEGISGVGYVRNNVIHDMIWMVFPYSHGEISGNLLYNCGYPSWPAGGAALHGDALQINGSDGGTYYIHDNVIHDTGYDGSTTSECEAGLYGNAGETDYVWNNVLYNIHGNSFDLNQAGSPGYAAYYWNNTAEGGADGTYYCFRAGHSGSYTILYFQNNHCISSKSQAVDPSLSASTLVNDHNLLQTPAQADANKSPSYDQYALTETYAYSPVASTNSTLGAGTNLSSNCPGGSLAGLCSDTSYACSVKVISGVVQVVCPNRTTVARPSTGNWGIGAYQGVNKTPASPTGLTTTIVQ